MKSTLLRIATVAVLACIAASLTGQTIPPFEQDPGGAGSGGGGGSCFVCQLDHYGDAARLMCASPSSGGWGSQNCRIESYPEGTWCFTDGNACCVD